MVPGAVHRFHPEIILPDAASTLGTKPSASNSGMPAIRQVNMKALLIVDVQYDFLPGGALAVPDGDQVVGPIRKFRDGFDTVIFTQDWHPMNHCSFEEYGGSWPVHCVQGSGGAEIERTIYRAGDRVVRKGTDPGIDSYSGFRDNGRRHETGLDSLLKENRIDTVFVCGLATDYCVKFTALDAVESGYTVYVVTDACRSVDVHEGDGRAALVEMEKRGVRMVTHAEAAAVMRGEAGDRHLDAGYGPL